MGAIKDSEVLAITLLSSMENARRSPEMPSEIAALLSADVRRKKLFPAAFLRGPFRRRPSPGRDGRALGPNGGDHGLLRIDLDHGKFEGRLGRSDPAHARRHGVVS